MSKEILCTVYYISLLVYIALTLDIHTHMHTHVTHAYMYIDTKHFPQTYRTFHIRTSSVSWCPPTVVMCTCVLSLSLLINRHHTHTNPHMHSELFPIPMAFSPFLPPLGQPDPVLGTCTYIRIIIFSVV